MFLGKVWGFKGKKVSQQHPKNLCLWDTFQSLFEANRNKKWETHEYMQSTKRTKSNMRGKWGKREAWRKKRGENLREHDSEEWDGFFSEKYTIKRERKRKMYESGGSLKKAHFKWKAYAMGPELLLLLGERRKKQSFRKNKTRDTSRRSNQQDIALMMTTKRELLSRRRRPKKKAPPRLKTHRREKIEIWGCMTVRLAFKRKRRGLEGGRGQIPMAERV